MKNLFFLFAISLSLQLVVFPQATMAQEQQESNTLIAILEYVKPVLRQVKLEDELYRVALNAHIILENGESGRLEDIRVSALVRIKLTDTGEISDLKVLAYP